MSGSEQIPINTTVVLNWSSKISPTRLSPIINSVARDVEISPLAIGRCFVLVIKTSYLRSIISLKMQPELRIAIAPSKNSSISRGISAIGGLASATDSQHGHRSSQKPIGASARMSLK